MPVCEISPPGVASPTASVAVSSSRRVQPGWACARRRPGRSGSRAWGQVDHQTAVADRVAGDAVPAAAHRQRQVVGRREPHRRGDVGGVGAAGDKGRSPVDRGIPEAAGRVVTVVIGPQQRSAERGRGRVESRHGRQHCARSIHGPIPSDGDIRNRRPAHTQLMRPRTAVTTRTRCNASAAASTTRSRCIAPSSSACAARSPSTAGADSCSIPPPCWSPAATTTKDCRWSGCPDCSRSSATTTSTRSRRWPARRRRQHPAPGDPRQPWQSTRYVDVLEPSGLGRELRAVLRDRTSAWGGLILLRETVRTRLLRRRATPGRRHRRRRRPGAPPITAARRLDRRDAPTPPGSPSSASRPRWPRDPLRVRPALVRRIDDGYLSAGLPYVVATLVTRARLHRPARS